VNGSCICDPGFAGISCSGNITGTPIFANEQIIVELQDWEWKLFYFDTNVSLSSAAIFFGKQAYRGDPEFYFEFNQIPTFTTYTYFQYYFSPSPFELISIPPGRLWIGVYARKLELPPGSEVYLAIECLNDCNSAGTCDYLTRGCNCFSSYGLNCEIQNCTVCQNQGLCYGENLCNCTGTGYYGPYCTESLCQPECLNGGICRVTVNGTYECDCTRAVGYSGPTCSNFNCPECIGGTCISPNTCQCKDGQINDNCQNLEPSVNQTIQSILIAVVAILGVAIVSLGVLIIYMIFIKRRSPASRSRMGLAGMDELHDM
jgi:hypothetical protein